jgi:hypothetical protein
MKKTLVHIFVLILVFAVSTTLSAASGEKWPELEAFHKVMSETYHPAEDSDFKPIKERIGEMVLIAASLNTAAIPAEYNTPEIIETAKMLEAESRTLEEKIKAGATDGEIFKELNSVHDTFHKIVGLCNPKEEKH